LGLIFATKRLHSLKKVKGAYVLIACGWVLVHPTPLLLTISYPDLIKFPYFAEPHSEEGVKRGPKERVKTG
jgi:hypothetical protein